MEKQLFSWDGWDQQDTAAFSFYDADREPEFKFEPYLTGWNPMGFGH